MKAGYTILNAFSNYDTIIEVIKTKKKKTKKLKWINKDNTGIKHRNSRCVKN
jgi:hypothetical protein